MLSASDPDLAALQEQFEQQGYVLLSGFLEAEVIQNARSELAKLVDQHARKLLAEGKITDPLEDEPFETRMARLYESCLDDAPKLFRRELHRAGLFPVFFSPRLLDTVEAFLGPEIRLYPNYTARPKLPEWEGTLVLWHQDGGYTHGQQVEALRMLNVWAPLVPARVENGCMQFIPGTHKLGVVPHQQRPHYLEIAREYLEPRLDRAVPIEVAPGDVILFHNLLFHQGLPNHSRAIRWSLDWRYQDATQPTLRAERGHVARSHRDPASAVKNAAEWASLSFV
jgi:ectoine hydroxylase-related dioxygenase (phytanoyl-CoA dioxygenase family)